MPQHQFEIPQELRHLAEENDERARHLYLQFMNGVEQSMAVWSAPSSELMAPGFDQVRWRATKFAKDNADAAFGGSEGTHRKTRRSPVALGEA